MDGADRATGAGGAHTVVGRHRSARECAPRRRFGRQPGGGSAVRGRAARLQPQGRGGGLAALASFVGPALGGALAAPTLCGGTRCGGARCGRSGAGPGIYGATRALAAGRCRQRRAPPRRCGSALSYASQLAPASGPGPRSAGARVLTRAVLVRRPGRRPPPPRACAALTPSPTLSLTLTPSRAARAVHRPPSRSCHRCGHGTHRRAQIWSARPTPRLCRMRCCSCCPSWAA